MAKKDSTAAPITKTAKRSTKPATAATTPSRIGMFDAAHLKLNYARAVVDAVAMLAVTGDTTSLKTGSLTACLLHADELLDEAREKFNEAHAQPAGVHHG